ncbi:MAG: hypothetical protein KAJ20_03925 [Candidatus Aenigmarchaeota archaeon]|nr:hypothetical protein [Candidatus Aenigmarchaeota archaeon]MCK5234785.1 hypothetical protein [Candidatus Aenigmarchaeota archaeon]MCK5290132.1 hypothetical protein [Candidatus Aenigmarchaeota archaeon]MCK5373462.1 hypothetical protein [Candidatus Aenigmarchaeota archaeon]
MLKTISETPVTFAEAKSVLESKEKELKNIERELGHEQRITLEYLRVIPILDKKTSDETAKNLLEAVPTLKEHQVIMIIDTLPSCEEDVEVLFAKERLKLEKDQMVKVAEIIKKVKPAKAARKTEKKTTESIPAAEDKTEDAKKEQKE